MSRLNHASPIAVNNRFLSLAEVFPRLRDHTAVGFTPIHTDLAGCYSQKLIFRMARPAVSGRGKAIRVS
jgi:hypothetical protein